MISIVLFSVTLCVELVVLPILKKKGNAPSENECAMFEFGMLMLIASCVLSGDFFPW